MTFKKIDVGLIAAVLIPFLVYLMTLSPTVQRYDSAELATGAYLLGIVHAPGYPLYLLLGKAFTLLPFGDVAYRVNLMSAVFAALACGFVYLIGRRWSGSRPAALAGAAMLAFSFSFWQQATAAEVYTLQACLMGGLIWLLLRWDAAADARVAPLLGFAFLYGLSLGNHVSGGLLAAGFACIILTRLGWRRLLAWRTLAGLAACFAIGLSIYLYLPLRALANPALDYVRDYYHIDLTTPTGLLWMMSGQMYRFFSFAYQPSEIGLQVWRFAQLFWINFAGVGVLLGLLGLARLFRSNRRWAAAFLLFLLPLAIFYINYRVVDKDEMFVTTWFLWALLIAPGLRAAAEWLNSHRPIHATHHVRRLTAPLALLLLLAFPAAQALANYERVDKSADWSWRQRSEETLATVEPGTVVVAPWQDATVLEYMQLVEGNRPDVQVFNRSRYSVAQFYEQWAQGADYLDNLTYVTQSERQAIEGYQLDRPVYVIDPGPMALWEYFLYLPLVLNR